MSAWIFDTDQRDFEREVVERSKQVPIVVDFWAPWCTPCRTLGPLLERLAIEYGGAFLLAKVNVDENQQLAAAFGVRSIPAVLGLRDGTVAAEFVGALPEASVREFLARVLPSEAEQIAGEGDKLYAGGGIEAAAAAFRRALALDARCDRALLGLARVLVDHRQDGEALPLLERVGAASPLRQEADRVTAAIRVREASGADEATLRAQRDADPADLDIRLALAQVIAAHGRYEEALREYLEIVIRSRTFKDGAARKAMLDIFEILGPGNETVDRYRAELARVLFS